MLVDFIFIKNRLDITNIVLKFILGTTNNIYLEFIF